MSKPGFFFYTGDYIKDTRVLSAEERGCWADALCFLNEHGGSVTWPITAFARFWGVPEATAVCVLDAIAMANVGICQWQNDDKTIAKLSNRRILRESEKRNKTQLVRAEAGKKGAAARWQKCGSSESSSSSSSLNLNKTEEIRISSSESQKSGSSEWPPDWLWLKKYVSEQKLVELPVGYFENYDWWNRVSFACGGVDKHFLEVEFAKMGRWLQDNPRRKPTPKGFRQFVATWLERAHEKERRFKIAK